MSGGASCHASRGPAQNGYFVNRGIVVLRPIEIEIVSVRRKSQAPIFNVKWRNYSGLTLTRNVRDPKTLLCGIFGSVSDIFSVGRECSHRHVASPSQSAYLHLVKAALPTLPN